jgi:hypothetical protein
MTTPIDTKIDPKILVQDIQGRLKLPKDEYIAWLEEALYKLTRVVQDYCALQSPKYVLYVCENCKSIERKEQK